MSFGGHISRTHLTIPFSLLESFYARGLGSSVEMGGESWLFRTQFEKFESSKRKDGAKEFLKRV
jgi:hypothetical protein